MCFHGEIRRQFPLMDGSGGKLTVEQLCIGTVLGQQFRMGPLFDDRSLFHDQDLIGIDQYSSPISSFLSDDYLSVRVDDSLSTVLEKVADYGEKDFGILPVLDAEGAIRGFLNRSSLLSTLSRRFIDEPVERDEQEGA